MGWSFTRRGEKMQRNNARWTPRKVSSRHQWKVLGDITLYVEMSRLSQSSRYNLSLRGIYLVADTGRYRFYVKYCEYLSFRKATITYRRGNICFSPIFVASYSLQWCFFFFISLTMMLFLILYSRPIYRARSALMHAVKAFSFTQFMFMILSNTLFLPSPWLQHNVSHHFSH